MELLKVILQIILIYSFAVGVFGDCTPANGTCTDGKDCCSTRCDTIIGKCHDDIGPSAVNCLIHSELCVSALECCSKKCIIQRHGRACYLDNYVPCAPQWSYCYSDYDCCSRRCEVRTKAEETKGRFCIGNDLPGTNVCKGLKQRCYDNIECCESYQCEEGPNGFLCENDREKK